MSLRGYPCHDWKARGRARCGSGLRRGQDEVFTFTGGFDEEFRADAGFVHDIVGVDTSRVDHPTGKEVAAVGLDADDAAAFPDEILKSSVEEDGGAVVDGVFGSRDGDLEGGHRSHRCLPKGLR